MAPTRTVHWGSFIAVHCPNLCIVVHRNDQGFPVKCAPWCLLGASWAVPGAGQRVFGTSWGLSGSYDKTYMSYARTLVTDMTQLTYVMRARRDERGAGRLCNSNGKSPFVTICTRYTIRIFKCNRGLTFCAQTT